MSGPSDAIGANVAANLTAWDRQHSWEQDGDEWTGQAAACGVAYEDWKASLVEHLLVPNVHADSDVMEIGAGHGRWSEYLITRSRHVTLVDISPNCLKHCMTRFNAVHNVSYFLTDGRRLPHNCDGAIDLIWSFDSFVHMAPEVFAAYLHEFRRVLRPGGRAIIHHANSPNCSSGMTTEDSGWRSAVTADLVRELATRCGLEPIDQFAYWDKARSIGVPRFGDCITITIFASASVG
jgi:ubiquinone/menaquinone biosynthesis C-methylase UbiE